MTRRCIRAARCARGSSAARRGTDEVFRRLGVGARKLRPRRRGALPRRGARRARIAWLGGGDPEALGDARARADDRAAPGLDAVAARCREGPLRELVRDIVRVSRRRRSIRQRTLKKIAQLTGAPQLRISVIGVGDARRPLIVDDGWPLHRARRAGSSSAWRPRLAARLAAPSIRVARDGADRRAAEAARAEQAARDVARALGQARGRHRRSRHRQDGRRGVRSSAACHGSASARSRSRRRPARRRTG